MVCTVIFILFAPLFAVNTSVMCDVFTFHLRYIELLWLAILNCLCATSNVIGRSENTNITVPMSYCICV